MASNANLEKCKRSVQATDSKVFFFEEGIHSFDKLHSPDDSSLSEAIRSLEPINSMRLLCFCAVNALELLPLELEGHRIHLNS